MTRACGTGCVLVRIGSFLPPRAALLTIDPASPPGRGGLARHVGVRTLESRPRFPGLCVGRRTARCLCRTPRRRRAAVVPIVRRSAGSRRVCAIVGAMHHQRLVLNGPPTAVARMAADLRAAGAVWLAPGAPGPARLVVASPEPPPVERLCSRHAAVIVGVERFEALGEELERLVLHGGEATVLERRRVVGGDEEDGGDGAVRGGGVCLDDDDGAPLDRTALRA